MNNRSWSYTIIGTLLVVLLYFVSMRWLNGDGLPTQSETSATVRIIEQINTNQGRGNLLGIQPWMTPEDYRDELHFRQKLHTYLQTAKDSGLIVPQKTIVVLPEYLGTWLVAANEPGRVYSVQTVQDALTTMVLSSPLKFWTAYQSAPDSVTDKTKYAVFAMKAPQMAEAYQTTFTRLAAEFNVTIVAGSILLQNPSVQNGKLTVANGPLYNVSALFRPNGQLDAQLIKKVYPITDEQPFVCPANPANVPVFDTPVGKLGVLVCADSWNSSVYQTLKQKGATLLAVPSYSAGDGIWNTSWGGYSGTKTPDAARKDVGKLTEGQAWLRYAMAGRAQPEAGISNGMNVFLRGKLWDLGSDGGTIVLNKKPDAPAVKADSSGFPIIRRIDGATLTCLWL